jgi:hypothetical protein
MPYLIIVLPLFTKLERRAEIPEVSRYIAHTVIWPVRVVISEGKYSKHLRHANR